MVKKDPPPEFAYVCTLNSTGGGNCVKGDGSRVFMLPSQLENNFCTDQKSIAAFAAWAYGISQDKVIKHISEMKKKVDNGESPWVEENRYEWPEHNMDAGG